MSTWKEIKIKDIEIDDDGDLNFFLGSDDFGNNYAYIKYTDLLEILRKNNILQNTKNENDINLGKILGKEIGKQKERERIVKIIEKMKREMEEEDDNGQVACKYDSWTCNNIINKIKE